MLYCSYPTSQNSIVRLFSNMGFPWKTIYNPPAHTKPHKPCTSTYTAHSIWYNLQKYFRFVEPHCRVQVMAYHFMWPPIGQVSWSRVCGVTPPRRYSIRLACQLDRLLALHRTIRYVKCGIWMGWFERVSRMAYEVRPHQNVKHKYNTGAQISPLFCFLTQNIIRWKHLIEWNEMNGICNATAPSVNVFTRAFVMVSQGKK